MQKPPSRFAKVFGIGPIGLFVSLLLFALTLLLSRRFDTLKISDNRPLLTVIFVITSLISAGLIVWSVKSLPTAERGNHLHTSGAYKHVRHPLYASFLWVFDFGLALFLNSYLFVFWALLLHPIWHLLVRYEERLMVTTFKDQYLEYQKRAGRFFPKIF